MASKLEKAPVCPECNRSEGIVTETTASFEWRRGAWRLISDVEYTPDLTCPCGHMWSGD